MKRSLGRRITCVACSMTSHGSASRVGCRQAERTRMGNSSQFRTFFAYMFPQHLPPSAFCRRQPRFRPSVRFYPAYHRNHLRDPPHQPLRKMPSPIILDSMDSGELALRVKDFDINDPDSDLLVERTFTQQVGLPQSLPSSLHNPLVALDYSPRSWTPN